MKCFGPRISGKPGPARSMDAGAFLGGWSGETKRIPEGWNETNVSEMMCWSFWFWDGSGMRWDSRRCKAIQEFGNSDVARNGSNTNNNNNKQYEIYIYMSSGLGRMPPPPRGWVFPTPVSGQGCGIPYGMACFLPEWSWKSLWSIPGPSRTSK